MNFKMDTYKKVIQANISLHTKLAGNYNTCEPHFRPENIEKVESVLKQIASNLNNPSLLDMGCGTGFIINIAKKYFNEIHGVDVTQAMLDKVDVTGNSKITLFNHDTGSFPAQKEHYDAVTAYSFLHHLYDIVPTIKTAFNALKKDGVFYSDLDPNYYFWEQINNLNRNGNYDPIVKREIEMVTFKDEDIEKQFNVDKDIFNNAEYGKNIAGGFKEDEIKEKFLTIGFRKVDVSYHWYIGQGYLINDPEFNKEERFKYADVMNKTLQKSMPLSRHLFKYLRVIATK